MSANASRRTFLAAAGAIPFGVWMERRGLAQPATKKVRHYDARSSEGVQMLGIYASAVKAMNDPTKIAVGDPKSWTFQWYTHFVRGDSTKAAQLQAIYPNAADPNRATASAMWNTCQAHTRGQNEDFFLPWHRCFVYFFEQIIASVSGHPEFTLPYWNYSTSDTSIRGVIPPQFTVENDPVYGSLFDGLRNDGVNAGQPIQGTNQDDLSLDSLTETTYRSIRSQGVMGFNMALDKGLHGNVHGDVGGITNMGAVPYAARDPIFWLHHCNLDRLWGSWNAAGNVNPALNQQFTFADGTGQMVRANIADFLDLGKLNYTYDRFEPIPGAVPGPLNAEAVASTARVAANAPAGGVTLGAAVTRVELNPTPTTPEFVTESVSNRVASARQKSRIVLVASDLTANAQPGTLYRLYLDVPQNATPQQLSDHYVGVINFFGAEHDGDGHGVPPAHEAGMAASNRFVSFDVTGKIRALATNGSLNAKPVVSIIPSGKMAAGAVPVIGTIELLVR